MYADILAYMNICIYVCGINNAYYEGLSAGFNIYSYTCIFAYKYINIIVYMYISIRVYIIKLNLTRDYI